MERIKKAGHIERGWMTISAGVRLDYKSSTVWPKIAESGKAVQDKQWTPMGASPIVPEEEEAEM